MKISIIFLVIGYSIGYCTWEKDPLTDVDDYILKSKSGCCDIDLISPSTVEITLYFSDLCKSPNSTKIFWSSVIVDDFCNYSSDMIYKSWTLGGDRCSFLYKHSSGTIFYDVSLKHDTCGDASSSNY